MSMIRSLLVVLLASMSTVFCSLESIPAHVDGVLTAYHGDQISLMCSHNRPATAVTKWLFTPPVDCTKAIDHHSPTTTSSCGPFMFVRISELSCCHLNSTAMATATSSMTGTTIECRDSAGISFNVVGQITLCIIDLPQPPSNISWSLETTSIMWNPVPQAACSMKDLSYFVTIIPLQPDSNILLSTKINTINLTSFQYNKTYTVLISTQIKADQLQSETVSALMFTTPMDEGHSITGTSQMSITTSMEPGTVYETSSTSIPCSCHNLINSTTNASTERINLAVAVSIPAAIFLTLCIGLIVCSILTYCFMKTCTSPRLERNSSIPQRPIYEEITLSRGIPSEMITLEENAAYGPVGMTKRVPNK